MTCEKAQALADSEAGELTRNDAADLARHVAACRSCARSRALLRDALADLGAPAAGSESSAAFIDRVTAAVAGTNDRQVPDGRRRSRRPVTVGLLLVAAGVVLALRLPLHPGSRPDQIAPEFQARGGSGKTPGVEAAVRLLRGGRFRPLEPALAPTDAFGVMVTNQTNASMYLLAFALDAGGEVHWLFPEYRAGAAAPQAVRVPPDTRERTLDEVVQPERVRSGPFRVVTVLLSRPISVHEVERRLRGHDVRAPVGPAFPGATVQEWTSTWNGQP